MFRWNILVQSNCRLENFEAESNLPSYNWKYGTNWNWIRRIYIPVLNRIIIAPWSEAKLFWLKPFILQHATDGSMITIMINGQDEQDEQFKDLNAYNIKKKMDVYCLKF